MYALYKHIKKRREAKANQAEGIEGKGSSQKKACRHQLLQPQPYAPASDANDLSIDEQRPALSTLPVTGKYEGPCQLCKKEKHDARVYRWKLIVGLLFPYFVASVDLTIVASALPFIASHFNKLDQLNWIVTAFTLTSTAFIPAFGQLADVFGRHFVLQLAMFLMLIGSVLCAAAQTWAMLLLGRALQGTSSAGIMNIISIVLADKVSLKDNATNTTIFQFVAGISYSVGPIIGGYLTNANWRYCFVITIPVAVFAHVTIFFLLRKELIGGTHFQKGSRRVSFFPALATMDIGGTLLFIFGVGLIILGTSWGGSTYPWISPAVLAPIIIGAALLVLFFVYEYFLESGRVLARVFPNQTPMLPFSLFSKRDTALLAIVEFAAGASLYSVFYFIGIYFTLVEAYSAGKAGTQLLFYIPGLGAGVYFAMITCNVWPAQTFVSLFGGTVIETVGIALLTWAVTTRNLGLVNGMMAVAGAGTGMRFMPATLHTAGIWPDKIAPAMSIMRFALPFGGTLALTIMGSVFNNKMSPVFNPGGDSSGINLHSSQQSLDSIGKLPPAVQEWIRNTGKSAVMWAFISILPILGISLVTAMFMGNVWIKKKEKKDEKDVVGENQGASTPSHAEEEDIASSEVIFVPYLWALFKGNIDSYKHISKPVSKAQKERQAQPAFQTRGLSPAQEPILMQRIPDVESPPSPSRQNY